MANQRNYSIDITSVTDAQRFSVSRIIGDMRDSLLEIEIPSNVNVDDYENIFLEMHVYSLADNQLIYSTIIDNAISDTLKINTVTYSDKSTRRLLFIDFSKVSMLGFPVGNYSVTFNLFSKEVGSYDNKSLIVNKISPSRREVELLPTPDSIIPAYNFALPSISTEWVMDAIKQVFNQENNENSMIPTIATPMSKQLLQQQLLPVLASTNVTIDMNEVFDIAQEILDIAYRAARTRIEDNITSDKKRFTINELNNIITFSIGEAYDKYLFTNSAKLNSLIYSI